MSVLNNNMFGAAVIANAAAGGGDAAPYQIANSLRFNSDDGSHLVKNIPSGGGDVRKFTLSFWIKNPKEGTRFFSTGYSTTTSTER